MLRIGAIPLLLLESEEAEPFGVVTVDLEADGVSIGGVNVEPGVSLTDGIDLTGDVDAKLLAIKQAAETALLLRKGDLTPLTEAKPQADPKPDPEAKPKTAGDGAAVVKGTGQTVTGETP